MAVHSRAGKLLLALSAAVSAGCGRLDFGRTIEIRYTVPGRAGIPRHVRRLGIAAFEGATPEARAWGAEAADMLAARLGEMNRRSGRFDLIDRGHFQKLMAERGRYVRAVDAASAKDIARLADADAMIYGTVSVETEDRRGTRTAVHPITRRPVDEPHLRRFCRAAVSITVGDGRDGGTLMAAAEAAEFDSDAGEPSAMDRFRGLFGSDGDDVPPVHRVYRSLIEQIVQRFVDRMTPRTVRFREQLGRGDSDLVGRGNVLALAGEHTEALLAYRRAAAAAPGDDEARFNAGLMCERLGRFAEAAGFYREAFGIEPDGRYLRARRRVEQWLARPATRPAS